MGHQTWRVASLVICLCISLPLSAEEKLWPLSLKECILLALKNNLELQVEVLSPRILDTQVDKALAGRGGGVPPLDPILKASFQFSRFRTPAYVDQGAFFLGIAGSQGTIAVDKSENAQFSFSLEQRFFTGTVYQLSYTHSYRKTSRIFGLNPSYSPALRLTLTQPLLKGLGREVNHLEVYLARYNASAGREELRRKVMEILERVELAYWDVAEAWQNVQLKRKSLKVAEELLQIAQVKHQIGTVPLLEVTSARAAYASRKAELFQAEKVWQNASDRLASQILPLEVFRKFDQKILPLDLPSVPQRVSSFEEAIQAALENRPELKQQEWLLRSKALLVRNARHNRLPRLDLTGSVTLNGLGGDLADSYRFIRPKRFYDWQVGFSFSYPIFQRVEKAELEKALLEEKQARLQYELLKRNIYLEVKKALREFLSAKEVWQAQREASRFAKEKLEGEKVRYSVGKSTSHRVFQIEEEYTRAKTKEIEAKIAIVRAFLQLELAKGTLLKRYQIHWDEFSKGQERR